MLALRAFSRLGGSLSAYPQRPRPAAKQKVASCINEPWKAVPVCIDENSCASARGKQREIAAQHLFAGTTADDWRLLRETPIPGLRSSYSRTSTKLLRTILRGQAQAERSLRR